MPSAPRRPVVNRRLTVGQWHLPKWGCRPISAGGDFPEIVVSPEARMWRPVGAEVAIGWLLEWRATGTLSLDRQGARICSAHEHGPGFVFTTIADGNVGVWRPSCAVRRARRQRLRPVRRAGVRDRFDTERATAQPTFPARRAHSHRRYRTPPDDSANPIHQAPCRNPSAAAFFISSACWYWLAYHARISGCFAQLHTCQIQLVGIRHRHRPASTRK